MSGLDNLRLTTVRSRWTEESESMERDLGNSYGKHTKRRAVPVHARTNLQQMTKKPPVDE
eukprot:gene20591-7544_t